MRGDIWIDIYGTEACPRRYATCARCDALSASTDSASRYVCMYVCTFPLWPDWLTHPPITHFTAIDH